MENKEIRSFQEDLAEIRALGDSRTVGGYAIVFNRLSEDLGGFRELILPEAIEGVIDQSDILALLDHDVKRGVLARSAYGKGTLKLSVDRKGVKYEFDAPNFDLGNELVEGVRRGDIKYSSFAFSVDKDGSKLERRSDGTYLRTIKRFSAIYDVSPCYKGAYQDTNVALRSLDEFKSSEIDLTELEDTNQLVEEPTNQEIVEAVTEKRKISDDERLLLQRNYSLKFKNN